MIDVIRGNLVESRHACRAVIAHSSGRLLDTWGAINAEVYPRSAIKPLQAREGLAPFMDVSLTNLIGDPAGRVRPAPGWRD